MTPTKSASETSEHPAASLRMGDLAGKYLTFFLGGETYGIPVLKVREIISLLPITPVPQVPAYMKGVINLRGKVIPVIDLRSKFHLPYPLNHLTHHILLQ